MQYALYEMKEKIQKQDANNRKKWESAEEEPNGLT
jgi:hypothetical protein